MMLRQVGPAASFALDAARALEAAAGAMLEAAAAAGLEAEAPSALTVAALHGELLAMAEHAAAIAQELDRLTAGEGPPHDDPEGPDLGGSPARRPPLAVIRGRGAKPRGPA